MVSLLLPHAVRRERATRALNAPFLHLFIASALMYGAIAASSFQSASPPGSSEFYENIDVDTLDDSDEVIGSDGTLKETSADIHDILELIEDGRLYPVLSKDENQYMPSTSTSKNTGEYLPTTHSKDERKKDTNTLFLDDFEQSAKKRRKRNEQVFMQDKGAKFKPNFIEKDNINISKVKMLITPKNTVKLSKAIPKQNIVEFINFIKNNHTHINSDQITERNKQSIKENNKLLSEEIRNKREVTNPGLNKTTGESSSQVKEKRVKTGDTILNIKGAVRDSIGDAVAGGAEGASVLDAIVIHPSQYLRDAPAANNYTDRTPTETGSVRTTGAAGAAGAAGERQLLAERRSRVRLDCDLPANISVAEWVKDGEPQNLAPGAATGATVWWAEESSGAAVVGRAGRGEAGEWRCAGYDHNGDKVYGQPLILTVYEESRLPYLELDGRRLDPGNTWVPVETGVVLEVLCIAEGGVPAPELTWRLVGSSLGRPGSGGSARELRRLLRATPANYTQAGLSSSVARVSVTSALHNASLECDATQPRPEPRHPRTATARLLVHVTYPPSFVISRYPGFGVALWTGGQAALRCDVDSNPRARAWWVRDEDELVPSSSPPPADAPDGEPSRAILSWISLTLQNAGWYRCRAKWNGQEYSSIGYFLIVRPASERPPAPSAPAAAAPRPPVQHVEVPLGGSVQVHCPKGSVGCWGRRMIGDNRSELWTQAGSARAHGVLGIRGALYQEGGEYRCMGASAEDEQQLRELKRITLTVTGSPTATAVGAAPLSGGGRRLSCVACGRGVRVRWLLLPGGVLAPGDVTPLARAARLQPDPLAPRCALATLELAGGGEVWCAAAGEGGGALAVFPAPPHAPPHSPPRALASAAARAPAPPPRTAAPLALLLLLASCNVT